MTLDIEDIVPFLLIVFFIGIAIIGGIGTYNNTTAAGEITSFCKSLGFDNGVSDQYVMFKEDMVIKCFNNAFSREKGAYTINTYYKGSEVFK